MSAPPRATQAAQEQQGADDGRAEQVDPPQRRPHVGGGRGHQAGVALVLVEPR